MLELRISKILSENKMNVKKFSEKADIAYRTALDLQKGNVRRIDLTTLEKVCIALDVSPADIFDYTPPKKSKSKNE